MVTVKRWGSSMAIIIPKEMVKTQGIREGDDVVINVFRKGNLKDIFGKLKSKMSGQEFKDLVRKGWESSSDRNLAKTKE